ncbi:VCBS repeat-containing protein [Segetibacter sp.]|uniref:VCBS repeat-containing protein n=1 Tax=Segetibacter sp. TaxID=2231182 RepID=UPI002631F7A0|nr:VCBS repeat-containing protein [Segetibacter sp.]MCW3081287.1 repeat domain in Vibrio, Colwellia, Bradyrhizobium and Shewanella [Segetibacter sp.]
MIFSGPVLLKRFLFIPVFLLGIFSGYTQGGSNTLFRLLPSSRTSINFSNKLTESDSLNILNQANIYNGGGVGIGDFNNDGLVDMYFAGNMVSNKMYLNKGNFAFNDITDVAGVSGAGRWCTGVSVIDINNDGFLDLYVCASFYKDNIPARTNLLYVSQGLNKEGVPTFKESAAAYGLADTGFSTQAYFFDYDKDQDLDMYLVTNELYDPKTPIRFRPKVTNGTALNTDRLYRNNGDGTFKNVSGEAGILIEGWGHAACITDINLDGWPDIYVANDFVSNDLCYINNKNGTFTNRLGEYFKHTGWNAMGTDAVDINNDGFVDFISLEMLPETNMRKKRMLSGNEYYNYTNNEKYGYEHQYVRNVLQLNSGNIPGSHPVFNDIGYMAGVYQTDWSWCPLVADFDNDGLRDLIISNGLPRDVTDLDYIAYNNGQGGTGGRYTLSMTDSLPIVKLANYAFKNTDGLSFQNTTKSWGFNQAAFSNGAAYADLDNDGDLDVIINNINDEAFVYENTLNNNGQKSNSHTLTVKIEGQSKNINGIGASLRVYYAGKQQFYEHQPTRGYLSTDDYRAHFGLGTATTVDSVRVVWPDGKTQLLMNVAVDKTITVFHKEATDLNKAIAANNQTPLFINASARLGIKFKPKERDFVDYNIQPTIPHKLSQYGPGIAVGDVDNNGFEDFFLGGSSGNPGVFFMQNAPGKFVIDSTRFLQKEDRLYEDMGILLFDADNDKDLDLYIVSGSYEIPPNHPISNDRLFLNNGKGRFVKSNNALPKDSSNGSCVRAADIDGDGDLDLFVGGRVVSGAYPVTPKTAILKNEGGKFTDVTTSYCPDLQYAGMITDALWSDFNNDGKMDLVVAGEWMPVTFFKNTGKALTKVSNSGIETHLGWWNSLVSGDFDNDGDIDYIAGNLGLNTNYKASPSEPITVLAKDLDNNGSLDAMVFCYLKAEDGSMKPYPMATKDDMISQLVSIRKKYPTYKAYGTATADDLWSLKDKEDAITMQANDMASSYIKNEGNGRFSIKPLPLLAQSAPVYGMVANDLDGDGNLDLTMVGNDYGIEPYSGRHDAFMGLCLKGDGKGDFIDMTPAQSGFFVKGDAKGLTLIHGAKSEELLIATQNQDSLVAFSRNPLKASPVLKWIHLNADDCAAELAYKDGRKRKVEFYYGSTYLSQSSRKIPFEKGVQKMTIINFKGIKREVL